MSLPVGSRLGHYEVTALTGESGMGQVYQATDTTLNRQVALKILPEVTAPVLGPIRRVLPQVGGLDFSPLVLLIALQFLRRLL